MEPIRDAAGAASPLAYARERGGRHGVPFTMEPFVAGPA